MLRLEDVSVFYGGFCALDRVSLHVGAGELVVLLGANGAGKSTIFKTISGLLVPKTGSITLDGKLIAGHKPSSIVASGVVHCPEGRSLFPQLSILKNLMLGAYVHRRQKQEIKRSLDKVFQLFPVLAERRHLPAGALSGGQQQMVAIGRAIMGQPRLLLLDEPSLGLAPLIVAQMFEIIASINAKGTTVLLAEQNAFAALRIASRAYVIETGHVGLEGTPDILMRDERVRKAYIGE